MSTRNRVLETTYDLTLSQQQRAQQPRPGAGATAKSSRPPLHSVSTAIGLCEPQSSADIERTAAGLLADVSPLKVANASRESVQSAGWDLQQRTATGHETDTAIKCDVELARIAMALCLSALFRIWLVLHNLSSENNGAQGFTRAQLDSALHRYGVQGCPPYISRLLQSGAGRFWRIDAHGAIFPYGYISICKYLIQCAATDGLHSLYEQHLPGMRKSMYIDVSGSMKDFEAHILAAWYECHNNPTISRFLLERWFNRSDVTLRKLERRARVEKTYNTAETIEPAALPLDSKGNLRGGIQKRKNRRGQTVYRFQLANTYHVRGVRQHPYRGQGRKATAVIQELLTDLLTGLCGAGEGVALPGESNRRGRLYYADYKRVRLARRKGRDGVVYSPSRLGERGHVTWDVWV